VEPNISILFITVVVLTVLSFFILKSKEIVESIKLKPVLKVSLHSVVEKIIEEADKNNFERVLSLLKNKFYSSDTLISSSIKLAIQYSKPIAFSNLLDISEQIKCKPTITELKNLFVFAQTEKSWGITTMLVRFLCQYQEEGVFFLRNQFEINFLLRLILKR